MSLPINCPYCNGPMSTEWKTKYHIDAWTDILQKTCSKKVDHVIGISSFDESNIDILYVSIDVSKNLGVQFSYPNKVVSIVTYLGTKPKVTMTIPWFEPNLAKIRDLQNKVKTYILFS